MIKAKFYKLSLITETDLQYTHVREVRQRIEQNNGSDTKLFRTDPL